MRCSPLSERSPVDKALKPSSSHRLTRRWTVRTDFPNLWAASFNFLP